MHAAIQLLLIWALAFLSLGLALLLLNLFYHLIDDSLELLSLGKEAMVAGIASFIEAASLWLVLTFIPAGARAMIIPVLMVVLLYKVAHLEDWGRFEVFLLLIFQAFIGCLGMSLFSGHFETAAIILIGFAAILTIVALFAKSF